MASESVVKVEVISRSVIKPSSPTPYHLRHLKLSSLDKMATPIYIPLISFYEANELKGLTTNTDHGKLIKTLQDSLSTTLTIFYPFAGRLNAADFSVNCNDDGVDFVEARVNSRLEDLLNDTKLDQLQKYFPVNPLAGLSAGDGSLFIVQVNYFSCGGIAVAACLYHYIGDGWSMIEFMNSWASTCRNETRHSPYRFGQLGRCFPAMDISKMNASSGSEMAHSIELFVMKRFVLNKDHLAAIKKAAVAPGGDSYPTRVEALTAFIWKNSIDNYVAEGKKRFCVRHVVNIRSRASKSLQLDHAVGNAVISVMAFADASDGSSAGAKPELHELVGKLRHAISKIDEEYIAKGHSEFHNLKELAELLELLKRGEVDEYFMFTSWARFPVYDMDFGWGLPVWICSNGVTIKNIGVFLPTRDGEGIEVLVALEPQHAEALEQKFKLIVS